MKRVTFIFILICGIAMAQSDVALLKIVNASKLTWLGLDFTDVTLIDSKKKPCFNESETIRDYCFKQWNEIIFSEPNKFNFREFFNKTKVDYRVSELNDSNLNVAIFDVIFTNKSKAPSPYRSLPVLQSIIDKYSFDGLEGIGATFIVTEMSKQDAKAIGYLVFVDFSTKKIMYNKLMTGDASGAGIRNYWLGAFHRIYTEIELIDWLRKESRGRYKISGSNRR